MKRIARIALALTALAACAAASAQPYSTSDQERRDRNREELMSRYGAPTTGDRVAEDRSTLRGKTHQAAEKSRAFGHRQAQKMRNFGDRQNARYGKSPGAKPDPYNHGPQ
jgi:hypothetical protein